MVRKKSIFIIIFINFFLLVSIFIPIGVITVNLKDYGVISINKSFFYTPSNVSSFKHLNLECEVANIEINYVYPSNHELISIIALFEISGPGIAHKSYSDYLNINFDFNSTSLNFTINIDSDLNQLEVYSLIKNITILVTIRADAVININTKIKKGDIAINVPYGIELENLMFNSTIGNITYDLYCCYIRGSIWGLTSFGDILLKTQDVKYSNISDLKLINIDGTISFNLYQTSEMHANVTGIGKSKNGRIQINYQDDSEDIGANFIFHNYSGGWPNLFNYWEGFPESPEDFVNFPDVGYIFTSFDYPTINNYNVSLYMPLETADYTVNLSSIPL